jgi:DNA-nicking Smr family endonuclease
MEPVRIPIDGNLDLHLFSPREVPDLIDDYFKECVRCGVYEVRVIHGKGSGILKKRVRSLLARHPRVESFKEAPPNAGGWGATLVKLKIDPSKDSAR